MKAEQSSLVWKISQTVAIVNINEMYCRAPRVLLPCPTGPTAVPYESYCRQNIKLQLHNIVIYLPSHTHCDTWLHLYNSIWTGAMNRPLRLRNVRCGLFTHTNVYPRAPTVGADLSCPHITEYTLWIFIRSLVFCLEEKNCVMMVAIFIVLSSSH